MRIILDTFVSASEIGEERFAVVRSACPEVAEGRSFWFKRDASDPASDRVLQALSQVGLVPWTDMSRPRDKLREYSIKRWREYDPSDLDPCEWLELRPSHWAAGSRVGPNEEIVLSMQVPGGRDVKHAKDVAIGGHSPVVSSRVHKLLVSVGFSHMLFRPTLLRGYVGESSRLEVQIPWERYGQPWWELTSDLILPPVSPYLTKIKFGSVTERVSRDHAGGVHLKEEGFFDSELHYIRRELARVPPFDVAVSFERDHGEHDRRVIVSQRFYQFFNKHRIRTEWKPVRIDEG